MERDELKKDIETMVADIWSEKEEVEVRKKTEEALQKSADVITELTDSLEDKGSEVSEITEKLTASNSRIKELETELEAAGKEFEKSKEELEISVKAIDEMKKDKAADVRMAELVEAGVAHSDADVQTTKVREMSDEDFVSYRDELISLKGAVEKRLAEAAEEAEKLKSKADSDVEKEGLNSEDTAMAALNLETSAVKELSDQYKEMGEAMATLWTEKKE
jgi:DNA repair exonuclease SbcCD ATPase subunit